MTCIHQYFVWYPLASKTALHLARIVPMYLLSSFTGMAFQAFCTLRHIASLDDFSSLDNCVFKSVHTCSIGFKSGLWGGQTTRIKVPIVKKINIWVSNGKGEGANEYHLFPFFRGSHDWFWPSVSGRYPPENENPSLKFVYPAALLEQEFHGTFWRPLFPRLASAVYHQTKIFLPKSWCNHLRVWLMTWRNVCQNVRYPFFDNSLDQ